MATQYQQAKKELKEVSQWVKREFNDNPQIRQTINDETHHICKEYDLSEKKQSMLHNYACTLHP
jgi:hypothetical protein